MAEGGSKVSDEQILDMLKSLNVTAVKNNLKSPTKEFLVYVFECFLRDLQIDIRNPELRPWETTKHIEDGDIYEDIQLLLLYVLTVNCMVSPSGLNITLKDIVDPKPKRTKKILYYIIVFWNNYIQKCARFNAIEQEFENEKKKAEDLMHQNELLDEKYNGICNTLQNTQPNKAELLDVIQAKKEKINEFEKQKEDLLAEYNALKTDITRINNQMGETDVNIVSSQKRLGELNQLILSSPERVNTEIQKLKDRIKGEDVKIKEKEAKLKHAEKKLRMQEETVKRYEKALQRSKDIDNEMERLRVTTKDCVALQEELDKEEDEVKKLQTELQQREDSKAIQMRKSCKVALTAKLQRDNLTDLLRTLQQEEAKERKKIEQLKDSIEHTLESINDESDAIIKISHKIREDKIKYRERIDKCVSRIKSLPNAFKDDCEAIIEEAKNVFPQL